MGFVISLIDFTPSPRFTNPATSWVAATIQEAALATGPWEDIETFELPVEEDPGEPTSRNFTSTNAQFASGWYRIQYADAEGNLEITGATNSSTIPQAIPSVDDMADLLFSRTKSGGGGTLGRFTEGTTPTASRVKRMIDKAYRHVVSATGLIKDPALAEDSKNMIEYYAGMLIELGSERTNKERYDELKKLYDEGIGVLIEANGGTGSSDVDEQANRAAYDKPNFSFPSSDRGIKMDTLW